MTYFASTADSNAIASALQVRQNQLLRLMTNAPWFVQNEALPWDFQLDPLDVVFKAHCLLESELITSYGMGHVIVAHMT
jgi:glucokinase